MLALGLRPGLSLTTLTTLVVLLFSPLLTEIALAAAITAQPAQGAAGTSVTVTGITWPAGDLIELSWNFLPFGTVATSVRADGNGAFTAPITVPQGAPPGPTYIDAINEAGNVTWQAPFTIITGGGARPLADLSPTTIRYNSVDLVPKRTVLFDSGVRNSGSQGTGVFNIRWFVDGVSVGYGSHSGVPANSTVLDGNSQYAWVATGGTHTIKFAVDVDNHVAESNESNNSLSVTVTVIEGTAHNLIVLVHGCCTDPNGVKEWVALGKKITKQIKNTKDWDIMVLDWSKNTPTHNYVLCPKCFIDDALTAYDHTMSHSHDLATAIINHRYNYVHLIGHSAGAKLIDETAKELVRNKKIQQKKPFIHLTFLDALTLSDFDKESYGFLPHYPDVKHYAEHYVDRGFPATDACLSSAFNFNISNWLHLPWEGGFGGHQWPRSWYQKSITSTSLQFYYGFPLSLEGGNNLINRLAVVFPPGKKCDLSNEGPNCKPADRGDCWK